MWMKRIGGLALASALATGLATARDERALGVEAGVYFPSGSVARDLFGRQWNAFSLSPQSYDLKPGLRPSADLAFLSRDNNGNRVFILMPTYGVRYVRGDVNRSSVLPYLAVRGGPAYFDYSAMLNGSRVSGKRIGFAANVEGGVWFSRSVRAYARYNFLSEFDQIRFDGVEIGLAVKLFRF